LICLSSASGFPTGHRHPFNVYSTFVQHIFIEMTWTQRWFNQCVPSGLFVVMMNLCKMLIRLPVSRHTICYIMLICLCLHWLSCAFLTLFLSQWIIISFWRAL
jgi:hypothetical protein